MCETWGSTWTACGPLSGLEPLRSLCGCEQLSGRGPLRLLAPMRSRCLDVDFSVSRCGCGLLVSSEPICFLVGVLSAEPLGLDVGHCALRLDLGGCSFRFGFGAWRLLVTMWAAV